MGWLWSSSQIGPQKQSEKPSSTSLQNHKDPELFGQQPPAPQAAPPSRQPLSRDEQAEAEFRDLLRELDQPPAPLNTLPADSPAPRHAHPSKVPGLSVDPSSIHPTNLYPRDLSCRAAFDQAFYCQSLGGQFTNVYRYGSMADCSESWSNFWFCMRTTRSGYGEAEKVERIRKHYWEREEKYRTGPSSEDIWNMRVKSVDKPFSGDMLTMEKELKEKTGQHPW